ncbi:hypothetical protein WJM97_18285 [Okeanomitos corallinicola TIOX110]|uniref:HEPN domain-containing protein n=1 Tax=Okeanomitos corallinicola TIOX110 TaxID=3133117 RepID=A0ABZ2UUS0_9CYAN
MTCDHYLQQAKSNEQAAKSLENTFPDWAVTICFYAALHCVEYYACVRGSDIEQEYPGKSPHERRRNYVIGLASQLKNRNLRKVYQDLEDESRKARYLQNLTTNAKVYYTQDKFKVRESFQRVQQIREILGI